MSGLGEVERLDTQLTSLARAGAAVRLRLGQALEVMSRGACFELGFSSIGAYTLERCERSVRWGEVARCLARRLEKLPELRRAMAFGQVSWSMGELLARVAQPSDEAHWISAAECRTVRQMRELVKGGVFDVRISGLAAVDSCGEGVDARATGLHASHQEVDACAELHAGGKRDAQGHARAGLHANGECGAPAATSAAAIENGDGDDMCTLTCTVDQEDAWLFEATRALLDQLGVHGSEAQVEALLAEGQGNLLGALPPGTLDPERLESMGAAERRWHEELRCWRAEAEALCEAHIRESVLGNRRSEAVKGYTASAAAVGFGSFESAAAHELDGAVRELSRTLARHELELSRLLLQFHRADGWRRLGYATEAQYARERLGLSRSTVAARWGLALRLEKLPRVAEALGAGQLGVEAASQVVRVATPSTQGAWVERARHRTVKHLREEVAAAMVAVRLSGEANCPPPADAELSAFHELERAVVSGRVWRPLPVNDDDLAPHDRTTTDDLLAVRDRNVTSAPNATAPAHLATAPAHLATAPAHLATASDVKEPSAAWGSIADRAAPAAEHRRAWLTMLGSLARWLEGGLQLSAAVRGTPASRVESNGGSTLPPGAGSNGKPGPGSTAGRVELRLRLSRSTYGWWRGLQGQARRWLPRGMSWLRFLCLSVWHAWRHLLGADVAYGQVYVRDRYRCMSPVCCRRDVTPHHLQFRSAGGKDDDDNVAALCTWCHLLGVHGGRIRAAGAARLIHWELGARGFPCLVVHGRQRMAA